MSAALYKSAPDAANSNAPLFPPFASIIWTFWIGFVRPEPAPNTYGPNSQEVST